MNPFYVLTIYSFVMPELSPRVGCISSWCSSSTWATRDFKPFSAFDLTEKTFSHIKGMEFPPKSTFWVYWPERKTNLLDDEDVFGFLKGPGFSFAVDFFVLLQCIKQFNWNTWLNDISWMRMMWLYLDKIVEKLNTFSVKIRHSIPSSSQFTLSRGQQIAKKIFGFIWE